MQTDASTAGQQPGNWCIACGRPLFRWQPIYAVMTLYGRAALCMACAARTPGAAHATWRDTLIGARDIPHWKK